MRGRWMAALAAVALAGGAVPATATATRTGAAPAVSVAGNRLVDASGAAVVLHGVNRSGGEFSCVQGNGIWDGPADQRSVDAMRGWHVNAVRVPLNEACWNGESYVDQRYAGANYQNAVRDYVKLLNDNGIVAILELHWSDGAFTGDPDACPEEHATCQKPMPDTAQAVPFWKSVAGTFDGDGAVLFDLFNEPFPSRATGDDASGWACWRDGGNCRGIGYPVAGMQSLVDTVRSTGARNVILLGGQEYANDLSQWLRYEPHDPTGNLAASWHSYDFNGCVDQSCWDGQIAPVAATVPLVVGEFGEDDCATGYVDPLMRWLDGRHASYLAWTWNTWGCRDPALISDYDGTPTTFGAAVRAHFLAAG